MVFSCFAVYVLANNTQVVPYFYRLKIWYNPCIIRQYIHSKTAENHLLFSNYLCGNFSQLQFGNCVNIENLQKVRNKIIRQ